MPASESFGIWGSGMLVEGLQANLESGARDQLLFGRNEPGLQHRHIAWAEAIAKTSSVVDG
ncbi:MAG TPA: hypothetical protein VEF72_13070 [Mycobacterium sp.]|nr:hypothetical protein [Mycobacterium sp.]